MVCKDLSSIVMGATGLLALVLACLGIYGVLAYAVSQRLREIGVRVTPGKILGEILSNGLGLAALGLSIGLGAALALTRYLFLVVLAPITPLTARWADFFGSPARFGEPLRS